MSNEDNGIEVVLEEPKKADDDTPKVEIVDDAPEKQSKKAEKHEVSPEEGIFELKKSLEREKQARLEAERRAHQATQQAQKAQIDKSDSDYQLVVNAIETVKAQNETLKSVYAEAMAAGDYSRAAEVQESLSMNANQLADLKRGEKPMKEQLKANEESAGQQKQPQGDIVDQLAANVSQRSAEWLRESRDYLKSERDIRKMFRAHEDAIDDGIAPDTDEYFEFIENRIGIRNKVDRSQEAESPLSAASAPATKKSTQPPPAPVSRSTQRPNVMRLTAAEADMASSLGMSPEEYAKNKALAMKEGRYGH